ncbi:hypothetical protein, partial [Paenibacillus sediminis]|uniref:hypothetical protein n=1 Tax=Paenibacillus sediminis TaxID=664909 RepID=UPI0039EBA999
MPRIVIRRRQEQQITPYSRIGRQAASVRPELEVDSGMRISVAVKQIQPDTSNSLTASRPPFGLKGVGRREY